MLGAQEETLLRSVFRRVNSGGECGPPRGEGGRKSRRSGVPGEAFQPGDPAFAQISAPARAPRPRCSPSGNTPLQRETLPAADPRHPSARPLSWRT